MISVEDTVITPLEFSFLTPSALDDAAPDGYERMCAIAGLDPIPGGYGLLHCVRDGERWTIVTDDPDFIKLIVAGNGVRGLGNVELPASKFCGARRGWPDEWGGVVSTGGPGRNQACPCGSGQKYKWCHGRYNPEGA